MILGERTEPEQSFRNPDQVRFGGLDQTEAGRDNVHFLVTSLNAGRGTCLSSQAPAPRDSGRPRPRPGKSIQRDGEHQAAGGPGELSLLRGPSAAAPSPHYAATTHLADSTRIGPRIPQRDEPGLTDRSIVEPFAPGSVVLARNPCRRAPRDACASRSVRSGEATHVPTARTALPVPSGPKVMTLTVPRHSGAWR